MSGTVGVAGLCAVSAWGATYDTMSYWNQSSRIQWFAVPDTTTYGETFLAPGIGSAPEVGLDSFSFNLKGAIAATRLDMTAVVFGWSGPLTGAGGGAVGAPLYISHEELLYTGNQWETLTVNTPGVALVPGSPYVIALTMSDPDKFAASIGHAAWALTQAPSTAAGGGGFVFVNSGNTGIESLAGTWSGTRDYGSLAFQAVFSDDVHQGSVPDSGATLGLLVLGIGAVTAARRKIEA